MCMPTQNDFREAGIIDRIPPCARLGGVVNKRELKKLFFAPQYVRTISLFGPLANRTVLKRRIRAFDFFASVLQAR